MVNVWKTQTILQNPTKILIWKFFFFRNIFITRSQRLALGDFSHGKLTRENLNYSISQTSRALPFGTDVYLAPEVVKEIGDYQKSPAIDIW